MKKIFLSMFALACVFGAQKAVAQSASNCVKHTACFANISVNTGHTSLWCNDLTDPSSGCDCSPQSQSCTYAYAIGAGGSCPTGYASQGMALGGKCCTAGCLRAQEAPVSTDSVETSANSQSLENVFDDSRSNAYYGIVDTTNRSPNLGRTVSIDARLDACMGNTAVDQITASSSDQYSQWQTCTGSNYCGNTLVNGYCSANSNQVCLDRCNCKYQAYLATIGISVTCNNY